MQITEDAATANGLHITQSASKSTPLQKLLSLPPGQRQLAKDQRFDDVTSMRIAIKHYLLLKRTFAKAYFLDEPTSRDFAVLAFIAGDKVTTSLWRRGRPEV